jgi:hypothetical protein
MAAASGCRKTHVVFPEGERAVVLPIQDPLFGRQPRVEGTLPGEPQSLWMQVDTCSEDVQMLEPLFHRLGRNPTTERNMRGWPDPTAVLPRLDLGDLTLRDVVMHPRGSGVGQSVLSHRPWEIDWDRGTLTLDVPPWPEGTAGAVRVPLRRSGYLDFVELRAGGKAVDMALCTGSPVSYLPLGADYRGLSCDPFDYDVPEDSRACTGEASLGDFPIGRHRFLVHWQGGTPPPGVVRGIGLAFSSWPEEVGQLGLDVLALYRVRVVPGREMWLQPRLADVRQGVAERVSRWSWTRGCTQPGCVRADLEVRPAQRLEEQDPQLTFVLQLERPYPGPVTLVFACGPSNQPAQLLSAMTEDRKAPFPSAIGVGAPVGPSGRVEVPVTFSTRGWDTCSSLLLVDVVPASGPRAGSAIPWQRPHAWSEL